MSTSEEEGDDYLSGEVAKGDAQEDGEGDEEYARRLDRMMNAPRAKRKSGGASSAAQRNLQRKRISGRRARSVSYAESEDDDDSEDVAEDSQDEDEDGDGGASLSGDVIEDDDDGDSEGAAGHRRHGSGRDGLAGTRGGKHHRGDPQQPPIFFEQGPDFSEEVIERIDLCHMNSNLCYPLG